MKTTLRYTLLTIVSLCAAAILFAAYVWDSAVAVAILVAVTVAAIAPEAAGYFDETPEDEKEDFYN